jgi:alkylation response protein AidB-like acyl-CoA dehydrogenase
MNLTFTDEHEDLRRTVRQFMERESPESRVRELMETGSGYDPKTWSRLAEELGLAGLVIPEEFGGAGFGPVELAIAMEEMGRVLFCGPYLSTAVLAANALLDLGTPAARREWLPRIARGETIATLAFAEEDGRFAPEAIRMRATPKGEGATLNGVKHYVLDGQTASLLLVAARADDGLALFRVEPDAEGLRREPLPPLDLTRKLARLELAATPARRVSAAGDGGPALERVLARTAAALAAEQVGGAQRCLEMATDYAKSRLQFGRPIGSFQAIKHQCADLLVRVEFAKSAAYYASFVAAGAAEGDLLAAASQAKSYCGETFFRAAADNIQIHGGMGFTWEAPAHLYFKRAKASELLLGSPLWHRERLAERLGL